MTISDNIFEPKVPFQLELVWKTEEGNTVNRFQPTLDSNIEGSSWHLTTEGDETCVVLHGKFWQWSTKNEGVGTNTAFFEPHDVVHATSFGGVDFQIVKIIPIFTHNSLLKIIVDLGTADLRRIHYQKQQLLCR